MEPHLFIAFLGKGLNPRLDFVLRRPAALNYHIAIPYEALWREMLVLVGQL